MRTLIAVAVLAVLAACAEPTTPPAPIVKAKAEPARDFCRNGFVIRTGRHGEVEDSSYTGC